MAELAEVAPEPVQAPEWFLKATANQGTSHYFSYEGAKLHYLSWGEANSTKPILIFIHGFRGHANWWGFIAPFFLEHYQVYGLDFSGMGDSEHREQYPKTIHEQEIVAFIQHLAELTGTDGATVVGHSYGGGRLLRAASLEPALFTKVVAVDAHMSFSDDDFMGDPVPQDKVRLYESCADGMARFRLAPKQEFAEDYVVDYIASHSLKPVGDNWTWKFDPFLPVYEFVLYDANQVLPKITCPVDFIHCENSTVVSEELAKKIFATLNNPGRMIHVPRGQHHLMASHPVALICTLQALL